MEKKVDSKKYYNKSLKIGFVLLAYFFVTAYLFSLIGSYVNERFNIAPWGNIGTLIIGYSISFVLALYLINKTNLIPKS